MGCDAGPPKQAAGFVGKPPIAPGTVPKEWPGPPWSIAQSPPSAPAASLGGGTGPVLFLGGVGGGIEAAEVVLVTPGDVCRGPRRGKFLAPKGPPPFDPAWRITDLPEPEVGAGVVVAELPDGPDFARAGAVAPSIATDTTAATHPARRAVPVR